jgi:hypothetical protein
MGCPLALVLRIPVPMVVNVVAAGAGSRDR